MEESLETPLQSTDSTEKRVDSIKSRTTPENRFQMDPQLWQKIAGVFGVAAVALGAYGTHMFKPQNPSYREVWQTALLYHLAHSAALLAAPLAKHPNIFGGLLTAGVLAFSGSCYTAAYLEDKKYSILAPYGGFAFIAAWASLLF
ncbi:transmembrane protein 256-like protein [Senna tora]|uniref:Transmembrane protein 256-like protein n=1 Tax=Senna tora TaxID=362788 RepID=A0A835C2X5_9FABA|nr:transmembrane protein 256-like protein [Senna tora]